MKIALCKSHFAGPVSGADETLVAYALALHEARHTVEVVLLYKCADTDQYYRRLRDAGVPVSFVVNRSLIFEALRRVRDLLASAFFFIFLVPQAHDGLRLIWQAVIRLTTRSHYSACRAFFRVARPDILHVFTPDSGARLMISAGHELGIPVLYQELGTPNHLPALDIYYREMEDVLPLCSEFGALSPQLAFQWSERFPALKSVTVLPIIGGDREEGFFTDSPKTNLLVFGFAGRLEEGKGPAVFVKAIERLNRNRPLGIARIAGVGPLLAEIKREARALRLGETCEFVGHYSEPLGRTTFLNSLDVFVLPSFAEGTPNCIVEAMAHGIPVIASEVGGIRDMIGDDAGIRVPPGDTAALTEAMLRLANDPELRRKMGAAAHDRYQKLFSPRVVVPLMLGIYQRVARNGHASKTIRSSNEHLHPWAKLSPEKV